MKFLKCTGREAGLSALGLQSPERRESGKGKVNEHRCRPALRLPFCLCPEHMEAQPPASQAKEGGSSGRSNRPEWFPACTLALSRSAVSDSCDSIHCSLPGSSVHGILQARILEWAAISFCRGSSQPRDRTLVSCTADRRFTV